MGNQCGVVLLWHGRGPNEAASLAALATALENRGLLTIAPNWDSTSPDGGRTALMASLEQASAAATQANVGLTVAGWSLGGTAALSLARTGSTLPKVDRVVGLAAGVRKPSVLDGRAPIGEATGALTMCVHLVHGRQDTVVPVELTERFAARNPTKCEVTLVDSDHAGVIGTAYDEDAGVCRASNSPRAQAGLRAAVAAITDEAAC